MKTVIFNQTMNQRYAEYDNNRFFEILPCFATGSGGTLYDGDDYTKCDVAVVFGSYREDKTKSPQHILKGKIKEQHQGPIIYIETPILGRIVKPELNAHWRIGIDHFLLHEGEFGMKQDQSSDRFDALEIELQDWHQGDYILLMLQLPTDASLMGQDHFEWAKQTIREIAEITDMPIKARPHPLSPAAVMDRWWSELMDVAFEIPNKLDMTNSHLMTKTEGKKKIADDHSIADNSLAADLKDAHCVITYTSGSAVDAIVSGTPVIALHPGNMVYPISSPSLQDILDPPTPDRVPHMSNLAYSQWTVWEMEQGLPWKHLLPYLKK